MSATNCIRAAILMAAPLVLVFSAGPAPAQGRGMMMPMQPTTMPMQPTMMNLSRTMSNSQVAALLVLLRQREAALVQALNQVQSEINALAMARPTTARNVTIMALQRQEAILMLAIRQTTAQIVALGG